MIAYFTDLFGPAIGPVMGLAAVLILLALGVWVLFLVIRRFRSGLFIAGGKGRAPRLAVIDAVPVDSHRRLVLVRRDDVEHLIMIGGPTDIVIEAGIGKPQPAVQTAALRAPPQMTPGQASTQQASTQQASPQQAAQPSLAPVPPQRSATMAARDAVGEAERGRPVRTPEAQLPQRRIEPALAPPSQPQSQPQSQQVTQSPVQSAQARTAVAPETAPVPPMRSAIDNDLDKLLDELRPNPLQDR